MTEAFRPTPAEFESIVRFWAESRIQAMLHRLETGTADSTDDLMIQEATDRLAELAEEIGVDEVGRIVAEVEAGVEEHLTQHEDERHRAAGLEIVRVLNLESKASKGGRGRSSSSPSRSVEPDAKTDRG